MHQDVGRNKPTVVPLDVEQSRQRVRNVYEVHNEPGADCYYL
jgi:hypothetical protein